MGKRYAVAAAALLICAGSLPLAAAAPTTQALEARVKALEDKEAIHDLIDRYNLLHNLEDWAGMSQLFAKNGELRAFTQVARGPAQVLALCREKMGQTPYDPMKVKGVLFNTSVLIIPTDADHARVESRWMYVVPSHENKPIPSRTGRYIEDVVREDGRWKLLVLYDPIDIPNGESNPADMPPK
ncbi:MAG: nuclear transport factor 2 family protein [Gammaproteobacteria bacterium]